MSPTRKPGTRPPPKGDNGDGGDLLSTRQASVIADVNPATITRWAREGLLVPVHRFGPNGYMVFARADVEAAAERYHAGTLR